MRRFSRSANFVSALQPVLATQKGQVHIQSYMDLSPLRFSRFHLPAVRDALVAKDLLKIEPRRRPQQATSLDKKSNLLMPLASGAGILPTAAGRVMPALGQHVGPDVQSAPLEDHSPEGVHSSTENSIASGQRYR